MTTTFHCYHCGVKLKVPDEYAGKPGSCKRCGGKISVPVPEAHGTDASGFRVANPTTTRVWQRVPVLLSFAALIALVSGVAGVIIAGYFSNDVVAKDDVATLLVATLLTEEPEASSTDEPESLLTDEPEASSTEAPEASIVQDRKSWAKTAFERSIEKRVADLLPTAEEDRFLEIPWRASLLQARVEASEQRKPMFMWVMNGDPLGCT